MQKKKELLWEIFCKAVAKTDIDLTKKSTENKRKLIQLDKELTAKVASNFRLNKQIVKKLI